MRKFVCSGQVIVIAFGLSCGEEKKSLQDDEQLVWTESQPEQNIESMASKEPLPLAVSESSEAEIVPATHYLHLEEIEQAEGVAVCLYYGEGTKDDTIDCPTALAVENLIDGAVEFNGLLPGAYDIRIFGENEVIDIDGILASQPE